MSPNLKRPPPKNYPEEFKRLLQSLISIGFDCYNDEEQV